MHKRFSLLINFQIISQNQNRIKNTYLYPDSPIVWITVKLFLKVAAPFFFFTPTSNLLVSNFSTFSPMLIIVCLFDYSHPRVGEVVSYFGFDLYFSEDWSWVSFHVFIGYYLFLKKCLFQFLVHFKKLRYLSFFFLLSCGCSLYVVYVHTLNR